MHRIAIVAALTLFLGMACGSASHTPETTLHSYAQALREGNSAQAYQLMSAEFRAKYTSEEFAAMLKEREQEAEQTADRLSVEKGAVTIAAELHYGDGEVVRLRQEKGKWRIVSNPLAFYSQDSPREAVRSFVRAYTLKRWDVMLRFVPAPYRERMTVAMVKEQFDGPRKEEMEEMMETIRLNLLSPTLDSQSGNQARLRYGERWEVELERQQGQWKIKRL